MLINNLTSFLSSIIYLFFLIVYFHYKRYCYVSSTSRDVIFLEIHVIYRYLELRLSFYSILMTVVERFKFFFNCFRIFCLIGYLTSFLNFHLNAFPSSRNGGVCPLVKVTQFSGLSAVTVK